MTVTVRAVLKKLYPSIIYMYIARNIYLHVLSGDQVLSEPEGGGGLDAVKFYGSGDRFDVPTCIIYPKFLK